MSEATEIASMGITTMIELMQARDEIKRLKEQLAKQEQGEPVAWISWNRVSGESKLNYHKVSSQHDATLWSHFPLYTTQQQRIWVGLSDEEMEAVRKQAVDLFVQEVKKTGKGKNEPIKFGRLVEAKLKEKNA